jgi:hypothetical protein
VWQLRLLSQELIEKARCDVERVICQSCQSKGKLFEGGVQRGLAEAADSRVAIGRRNRAKCGGLFSACGQELELAINNM